MATDVPAVKRRKVLDKDECVRLRNNYIAPSLSLHYREPLKMLYGKGQYLFDENHQPYLDCINNVTQVGHCHPRVVEACTRTMATLSVASYSTSSRLREEYCSHLLSKFPSTFTHVFFTQSGSEANDLALQIAEEVTGHSEVVVNEGAYHGHTKPLIGLSTYKIQQGHSGGRGGSAIQPNPHAWVAPLPDSYRGRFRDPHTSGQQYADEVKKIIEQVETKGKKVASFLCESLPGCAGQVQLPQGYLKAAFEYIRAAGGVCIADEVQSGFGRAGDYFWVYESQGVVPDVVTIGKPMGNGHPISAVVTTRPIAEQFIQARGREGIEECYGSDPVSLAVADSVLCVIEEEALQSNARLVGSHIMAELRGMMAQHPCIGDVRGYGLFIGCELVKDRVSREPDKALALELVDRVKLQHRILVKEDGQDSNVIKIKPPLCFSMENAHSLLAAIDTTLSQLGH